MNKEVVIARYKEDIDWIANIKPHIGIQLYNKHYDSGYGSVTLPNVGKEANTYLKHIVNNYDDLAYMTYFVKGDPFKNSPKIIEEINGKLDWEFDLFHCLCEQVETADKDRVGEFYEKLFGKKLIHNIHYGVGAQFLVKKEAIRLNPKEFYEELLEISSMPEYDTNELFECLWRHIFTKKITK